MKDEQNNKDDLIVDIDENQLALPIEKKDDDLVVDAKPEAKNEDVKVEAEQKRERKRHNQDAIDALKAQLDEANRRNAEEAQRRQAAEERAAAREAELEKARGQVAQSEYDRVQGYIAAANAKEESVKRSMKAALEIGDHDKVTDLQGQMAEIAARRIQYQDAKVRMERDAEREKEAPQKTERPAPQTHVDPFEARISGLSPKSQAWLRDHPECVNDEAENAKVMWAHKDALKKGIKADSPEYFSHLENLMGYAADSGDDGDDEVEVETPQRSESRRAMPSAPVSREARTGQVSPGKYRLTREEADMAEQLGMSPTEYAKSKLMAIKNGRYDNA